jgi:hypothetical protein
MLALSSAHRRHLGYGAIPCFCFLFFVVKYFALQNRLEHLLDDANKYSLHLFDALVFFVLFLE